jgi:4-hydroxy-2-oxoheptanedioate aldolase
MRDNQFKKAIGSGPVPLGLWQAFASALPAEVCAACGFDWLLFDGEHGPNTVQTLLAQIQAVSSYPLEAVARPLAGRPEIIKQYLDIGFRSLLIPMVGSAAEAAEIVRATRFPPDGIRGVASVAVRASGFGADADYLARSHEQLCLMMQIETLDAFDRLEEIAAVEGVDALFIGPSDLSASMGFLGRPSHPDAEAKIVEGIRRIRQAGKPAGIFARDAADAKNKIAAGASFVSLGTDIGLLANGCRQLVASIGKADLVGASAGAGT